MNATVLSVEERFWAKVNKTDTCWVWTASCKGPQWKDGNGYGQFIANGKNVSAHRFAYELVKGPIPEGLHLDHLCRVHTCVNPDHLEPVTCRENLLRGETVTARHAAVTECPQGHQFDAVNCFVDSRGQRHCRACDRASHNRRYAEDPSSFKERAARRRASTKKQESPSSWAVSLNETCVTGGLC